MRLTSLTDFSLRMLMHVAQHPERLCTIAEVARTQNISQTHLMKVTHQLALQGWLTTVRGKGGGIRLAMPPEQIFIGAVVRSIEPSFALVECFSKDSTGCQLTGTCRLAHILDDALLAFFQHLDRFTLADLLPSLSPATIAIPPRASTMQRTKIVKIENCASSAL